MYFIVFRLNGVFHSMRPCLEKETQTAMSADRALIQFKRFLCLQAGFTAALVDGLHDEHAKAKEAAGQVVERRSHDQPWQPLQGWEVKTLMLRLIFPMKHKLVEVME